MSEATLQQVTRLADQLSFEEKLFLVEHLAQSLRQNQQEHKPKDLRGIWSGRFPQDFDIDSALKDIRHEWEKEWPQVFENSTGE